MKPFFVVLVLVIGASGAWAGRCSSAEPPAIPAGEANSAFVGKVIMVFLDKEIRVPSFVLTDATIQSIGGREFLVGVGADTKRKADWHANIKTRIVWSLVTAYLEFTPDEYETFCQDAAAARGKPDEIKGNE